jgi:hypothetical protein
VQGAEPATTDLLDKRSPPVGYELSGRVFVAREPGGREQGFEEGKNIGHFLFLSAVWNSIYGVGIVGMSVGTGVSVKVKVGGRVGVKLSVGVKVDVKLGVKVNVNVSVKVWVKTGGVVGVLVNVIV